MAVSGGGGGAVRMRTCLSLITGIACPFLGSVLFGRHICSEYRGSENAEKLWKRSDGVFGTEDHGGATEYGVTLAASPATCWDCQRGTSD